MAVTGTGVHSISGSVSSGGTVKVCTLPPIEAQPRATEYHLGESLAEETLPDIAPVPGLSQLERLDRAVTLAAQGNYREALAEYREIQRIWPDVAWTKARLFVHGEQARPIRPQPRAKGTTWALVVGISRYQNEKGLRFGNRDAELFRDFLKSQRGGSVPESQIEFLVDEAATTSRIRDWINEKLKRLVKPADTLILFFACHGAVEKNGEVYLATSESYFGALSATALSLVELQKLLRIRQPLVDRVFLYLDACHAGRLGALPWRPGDIRSAATHTSANSRMLYGLLASGQEEASWEDTRFGDGHGVFSWFLVNGLNGKADTDRDQVVTIGELTSFVPPQVDLASRILPARQHPVPFGDYINSEPLSRIDLPGLVLTETGSPASTGTTASRRSNDNRVDREEAGQRVVLKYLKGEETPPSRQEFVQATADFAAARLLAPESLWLEAHELFCRGRTAIFDKNYPRARDLLERSIALDPASAVAYNALGIAYLEQADFDLAEACFRDAVRRTPYWSYAWHNLALVLTQRGDYRSAEATYRRAIGLAPSAAYLHHNLGLLYQVLNRRREAAESYRQAIALSPSSAQSYNALGSLRGLEGKRREAEDLFRKALSLDSRLLQARHNLGALLAANRRRAAEALALWRENLALDVGYLPSRLSLARALAERGETAEAIQQYEEILRQAPNYIAARHALDSLRKKRPQQ